MILVIGPCASGKRTYVRSLGYGDEDMAPAQLDQRPVVYDLQDLVSRTLEEGKGIETLVEPLLDKEVVICNEVGSGVIPADGALTRAREQTGRICILLAQQAQRVVRMVCGIPTELKG